jgi:excisionase family DNA binding protein
MSDTAPSQDPSGAGSPSPTMTVPELAERCGIDASTAYRYLRAGRLPGLNPGNGWIIDRQRVERFLAGREDAAGRPLIHETPTTDAPALTLLPERIPNTAETALSWLRGAQAAMEMLVGAAARAPSEGNEHRLGA